MQISNWYGGIQGDQIFHLLFHSVHATILLLILHSPFFLVYACHTSLLFCLLSSLLPVSLPSLTLHLSSLPLLLLVCAGLEVEGDGLVGQMGRGTWLAMCWISLPPSVYSPLCTCYLSLFPLPALPFLSFCWEGRMNV